VRTFLNILPHHGHYDAQGPFEFHVNDTFSVPFVGTVVSGVVKSGESSMVVELKSHPKIALRQGSFILGILSLLARTRLVSSQQLPFDPLSVNE
jgi:hypothetical protein